MQPVRSNIQEAQTMMAVSTKNVLTAIVQSIMKELKAEGTFASLAEKNIEPELSQKVEKLSEKTASTYRTLLSAVNEEIITSTMKPIENPEQVKLVMSMMMDPEQANQFTQELSNQMAQNIIALTTVTQGWFASLFGAKTEQPIEGRAWAQIILAKALSKANDFVASFVYKETIKSFQ